MQITQDTTIAQFVFDHDPALDLPRLVGELDTALQKSGAGQRRITWDCDDLAFIDVDDARFALGYADATGKDDRRSLMVSVGPPPDGSADFDGDRHAALCQSIAARLRDRFAPEHTVWHNVKGPVTTDLIDDLFDRLPEFDATPKRPNDLRSAPARAIRAFPEAERAEPVSFAEKAQAVKAAKAERARAMEAQKRAEDIPEPANTIPPILRPPRTELGRVRAALYPEAETEKPPETRMRIAAHTMDTTLMLVFLPAGAAMLTYSLLKGGNVNASARMMALTCTVLGLSQFSPWATEVLRFI